MKKALALILAVLMLLSVASFALAEDAQTLTIVAWDARPPPTSPPRRKPLRPPIPA